MQERLYHIERLRTLAALGIVWFHTGDLPYRNVGYAGLPIFILIFFMLIGMKGYEPTRLFIRKKIKRLIIPWLIWSVVYFGFQMAKSLIKKQATLEPYMLITGSAIHLWYLPYAFTLAVLVNIMQQRISPDKKKYFNLILMVLTILLSILIPIVNRYHAFQPPLAQWMYGLTACPAGWLVGILLGTKINNKYNISLFCGLIALICLVMRISGFGYLGTSYMVGFVVFGLAFCLPAWKEDILTRLAPLTFGVYLIHPLVGSAMSFLFTCLDNLPVIKVVLIIVLSFILTGMMGRIKNSGMFGMEKRGFVKTGC